MEFLYLIIFTLFIVFLAVKQRVTEAQIIEYNKNSKQNINNKGAKFIFSFLFFITISPFLYIYDFNTIYHLLFVIFFGLFRGLFAAKVQNIKATFKDTNLLKNTTLTLYENFTAPIATLLVFAIYYSFQNTEHILFYFITPFIGLFLLWALREGNTKLSKETIKLLIFTFFTGIVDSLVVIFSLVYSKDFITLNNDFLYLNFLNTNISLVLIIISFAMFNLMITNYKEFINIFKIKETNIKKQIIKNGIIHYIHDILFFIAFSIFGSIFPIIRRGILIPIQNLYLSIIDNISIKEMFLSIKNKPLLKLRGGKDFIISFVDILFNRIINFFI